MNQTKLKTWLSMLPLLIVTASLVIVTLVLCIILNSINSTEIKHEQERKEILTAAIIPHGVTISGMDVGGMNYNQAILALQNAEKDMSNNVNFKLVYQDKQFELNAEDLSITYNTEEVVRQALGMLSDTGYLALKQYIDEVKSGGMEYQLSYTVDPTALETQINNIYDEVYVAPKNAIAKLKDGIKSSYSTAISRNPFTFEKEENGLEVDKEALSEIILKNAAANDYTEIEIPVKEVEPQVKQAEAEENVVLRAYFKTSYASGNSYNRVHNIKTAANFLNGKRVAPGEVFSMEETIGRRVDPKIWKDAPAVISGGAATENQLGGGVCQVSTTLFNAVVKADMKIVFRKNHSKASSYVDPGLDATINTDTIDFKWKNPTDHDVYVLSWIDPSRQEIYCAVYGEPFPSTFNRIEFKSTFKKKVEPTATEYTKTSKLKEGEWCKANSAITGYVYEAYAYYYKGSKLVDTKFITESNYRMHPERYYVWQGYTEGAALNPALEMIRNQDGSFSRRYKPQPVTTTPPIITQTPVVEPTQDPNPTEIPNP